MWPINAQIFALVLVVIIVALLTVVGPDYIAPHPQIITSPKSGNKLYTRSLFNRDDSITSQHPDYTIYKAWWTAGGRTGLFLVILL